MGRVLGSCGGGIPLVCWSGGRVRGWRGWSSPISWGWERVELVLEVREESGSL